MKVPTIQIEGREYVVIPREQYESLTTRAARGRDARNAGDLAESARRRGAGKSRSYAALRKSLGLKS